MLETFSFVGCSIEEIKVGESYYFGQLVEGEGDLLELLYSGCIGVDNEVVEFKIERKNIDILKTIVRVTDIY